MTMNAAGRGKTFWIGFLVIIVLIAGGVSYLASSSPDGLDSATLRGCEVIEVDGTEVLTGSCIARQGRHRRVGRCDRRDRHSRDCRGPVLAHRPS